MGAALRSARTHKSHIERKRLLPSSKIVNLNVVM